MCSINRLQTSLIYIPTTRPDPPSLLRQLAYQENTPLLGPEVDPEGWKSVPFHIRGTIFNTRRVEADCTVGHLINISERRTNRPHFIALTRRTCK